MDSRSDTSIGGSLAPYQISIARCWRNGDIAVKRRLHSTIFDATGQVFVPVLRRCRTVGTIVQGSLEGGSNQVSSPQNVYVQLIWLSSPPGSRVF